MNPLIALLATLSFLMLDGAPPITTDCERTPATSRADRLDSLEQRAWKDANRLLQAAYPGLRVSSYDSYYEIAYVEEKGILYGARVHFDSDESGYAALVLSYASKHDSALTSGTDMTGNGCRAQVELVLARMTGNGSPRIIARGLIDEEASTIDVRTMTVDVEDNEPVVKFMYHAYYARAGWFGYVTWRAGVSFERGRLVTQRLPATFVKVSGPARDQMQGYLAPAGGDPSRGIARLLMMAYGAKGEVEKEFEVPLVDRRWISGVEIMRRVP
jgi:hypothetical protein